MSGPDRQIALRGLRRSGALVFALLTWLVLTFLFRPNERVARGQLNIDRAAGDRALVPRRLVPH